ncbi:HCP-like protein [Gigaspora margarita]|uniref:HCP-like protein n=1 Tax=Gigaspora margarita TaxID=4874 RepID=A0A8H4A6Q5_GIGMA|nr:HCP-like protein [Gigaspora margarita]
MDFQQVLTLAEHGDSGLQCIIGAYYNAGINVPKDDKKAFEWYLKSAKGGNSDGQCFLASCYEEGVSKDHNKAFEWFLKSAEGGDSFGQLNVGFYYGTGVGTFKDEKKAFEWHLKSAEGGNPKAQFNIAQYYRNDRSSQMIQNVL